ncbi:MAG: hypothetical protein N2595_10660 [bacterium]|nr:hypothetical protein [bacterium]
MHPIQRLITAVSAILVLSPQNHLAHLVYVEFFYNPNCDHCREPLTIIHQVAARYPSCVTVLLHHVATAAQYRELMAREVALGVGRREPVAVYVGTNYLYGAAEISEHLETLVTNAIAHGGALPWKPPQTPRDRQPKPPVAPPSWPWPPPPHPTTNRYLPTPTPSQQ